MAAISVWRGDPLEDVAGEEWSEPIRERLRQRFVRGAVRAGHLLLASGRAPDAVAAGLAAVGTDPGSEPAIRLLVGAHLAAGDRSAATAAFAAGLRSLADLGVDPEAATEQLGRELRATTS